MSLARLTESFVNKATASEGKSKALFWDTELKGFGLLVRRSAKSFVVQKSGRQRVTLGRHGVLTVAQTRQLAIQSLAEIANPSVNKTPTITLREATDRLLL
jgi:hypothetical protein